MKVLVLSGCILALGFAIEVQGAEGVTALEERCRGGDGKACYQIGVRHEVGDGVQQSWRDAANYWKKSCSLKFGNACQRMAALYKRGEEGVEKDYSKSIHFSHLAASVHRESCRAGKEVDCFTLGLLYVEGSGIQQQCEEGMKLLREACERGTGLACDVLGEMYAEAKEGSCVKQNFASARMYFKKACEIGNGYWGCLELGNIYKKGLGVLPDKVEAIRFYLRGCMGDPQSDSCYEVESLCKEQKYPGCP